jgi:hypothetical protein
LPSTGKRRLYDALFLVVSFVCGSGVEETLRDEPQRKGRRSDQAQLIRNPDPDPAITDVQTRNSRRFACFLFSSPVGKGIMARIAS